MSWHFSQALVAAYSAATCSDGAPSAPSSATPTPSAYCSPDRMTDVSRLSRSGMTFQPLTADHGEAVLTWCRAASLVRTSAPPGAGPESPAPDPAYGERWRESFAKYDPDSCSWRTRQCSLFEGLTSSSVTWPRWGSMRNGECSERTMPELPTSGSGSGSSVNYPTPTTIDNGSRFNTSLHPGAEPRPTLGAMARHDLWPTPTATEHKHIDSPSERRRKSPSLSARVNMWPTPTCMSGAMYLETNALERKSMSLASAVHHWITPMARDYKGHTNNPETRGYGGTLPDQVLERSGGGQLNPTWVEWLMGWPLGWTDLGASATDRFQQWRRSHGAS